MGNEQLWAHRECKHPRGALPVRLEEEVAVLDAELSGDWPGPVKVLWPPHPCKAAVGVSVILVEAKREGVHKTTRLDLG